jgi:hypothetical protein
MDEPTPPPLGYGQLTTEVLDAMAPRLRAFMSDLTQGLQRADLEVETVQTYLLNSTDHPIEVPCSVAGVPLEAEFEAVLPAWSDEPVGRLRYSINHGRRFFKTESKVKRVIPLRLVVRRIVKEVYLELEHRKAEADDQQRLDQALEALQKLGDELDLTPEKGRITRGGLTIQALPQTPTRVALTVTVSHAQALEIVRKYGGVR